MSAPNVKQWSACDEGVRQCNGGRDLAGCGSSPRGRRIVGRGSAGGGHVRPQRRAQREVGVGEHLAAGVEREIRARIRGLAARPGCASGRPWLPNFPPSAGDRPARGRGACARPATHAATPCSSARAAGRTSPAPTRCRRPSRSPREAPRRASPRARAVRSVGRRPGRRTRGSRGRRSRRDASITRPSSTNGTAEVVGEHPSQRRLARAAQSDERDARTALRPRRAGAEQFDQCAPRILERRLVAAGKQLPNLVPRGRARRLLADQFGDRAAERFRELPQQQDRRVALARFQVREMAYRHAGRVRKRLALNCRRVRTSRTRSPSAARNGSRGRSAAGCGDVLMTCSPHCPGACTPLPVRLDNMNSTALS